MLKKKKNFKQVLKEDKVFIFICLFIIILVVPPIFMSNGNSEKTVPSQGLVIGKYNEGEHFSRLSDPFNDYKNTRELEVTEFFWYGCPHCYRFESYINGWVERNSNNNVIFNRVHPAFNANWVVHAKTFYTLKEMGIEHRYHDRIMSAIHESNLNYSTSDAMSQLLPYENREEFMNVYNNMAQNDLDKANILANKIGIMGVPRIIIDGRFIANMAELGSYEEVINMLDAFYQNRRKLN